jgi:hypothetical protein
MADYTEDQLFAKLERADAAGDAEAAKVIADEIRRIRSAKPDFSNVTTKVTQGRGASIAAPKQAAKPKSRIPGLVGRSMSQGAAGLIDALAGGAQALNPTLGGAVRLAGTLTGITRPGDMQGPRIPSRDILSMALDQQGVARPQTAGERIASDVGEAATGTLLTMGAGGLANAPMLTRGPVVQMLGALTGSGAMSGAREAGAPMPVQVAAGLAGGVAPSMAAAGGRNTLARLTGPRGSERRMGQRLLEQSGGPVQVQESQVPGVRRTLDEATDNQGIMAYGRNLRRLYPQEFADQDMANNAARYRTLEGIAGDEDAMEAALAARSAASAPLYREAGEAIVPVTDDLKSIMSRVPNNVMNSAKRLAKIEGRPWQEPPTGPSNGSANVQQQIRESLERAVRDDPYSSYGLRVIPDDSKSVAGDTLPPSYRWDDGINTGEALPGTSTLGVRRDLSDVEKMLAQLGRAGYQGRRVGIVRGEPVGAGDDAYEQLLKDAQLVSLLDRAPQKQSQAGIMSGQQLHYIKLAIDNALSGQGGGALGNVERALLMQVKDDLVDNVSGVIPAYADAMGAYSGASVPISRMDIGRRLLEKTDSSRVDPSGVPILSPFQYAKTTRNLDRVAQESTGFRKAQAANILSPEDIRNISAIGDDMQRIMRRQSNPAQPGSATMEATEMLKQTAAQGAMRAVGADVPVIRGLANYFSARRENKDLQTLFELYRNPQRAQQVMNQLSKKDRAKLNATLSMLAVGIQANNQEGQ